MPVPNTTTFNLLNVKSQIQSEGGGTINSLRDAFTYSNTPYFDTRYSGSKNTLVNFRNYGGGSTPQPACSSWVFNGSFSNSDFLRIKYVDCNNENVTINTTNSSSVNGKVFCVKRIYEVSMGTYSFNSTQLNGGTYNGTYTGGHSGTLSGGTSPSCTDTSGGCKEWLLRGYDTDSGRAYEIEYIDCNGVTKQYINDTAIYKLICVKKILYFDLVGNIYNSEIDGELLMGTYNGQSATLSFIDDDCTG